MHPYRGLVRIYIWSDILSVPPDDSNTLSRQSAGTNDTIRELIRGTITGWRLGEVWDTN